MGKFRITHHQWFGAYSVSLLNNTLLVGTSLDEGAAHVFRREAGKWTLDAEILASDRMPKDRFGRWVALDGEDRAFIGAFRRDGAGGIDTGAVYVYNRDSHGDWIENDIIEANDSAPSDRFGVCLAVMDGRLLVGAPYTNSPGCGSNCSNHGTVYFFTDDGDGDGVRNDTDNCPEVYNPSQEVFDQVGIGTCCDLDEIFTCSDGGLFITADFDSDGWISADDLISVLNAYGTVGNGIPQDVNRDGVVDAADLIRLISLLGQSDTK